MKAILRFTLPLTIFLIPVIGFNQSSDFELSKVTIFIYLTVFNLVLSLLTKPWKTFQLTKIKLIGLLFILALFLTSILGVDPQRSLLGKDPYYQGFCLYLCLYLFFLMVTTLKLEFKIWAWAISLSALLVSALALKDFLSLNLFHLKILSYASRPISSFGQPNFYSGFLVLSMPFSFYLIKTSRGALKKLAILVIGLTTLGILASVSRVSIAILVILLLGWLSYQTSRFKLTFSVSLSILLATLLVSFLAASGLVWDELERPLNSLWLTDSPEKRVFILPVVWEQALKKPITGYGLENLDIAWALYQKFHEQRSPVYYELKQLAVDRSHNYPLDLFIFSGVGGLFTWVVLSLLLLKKSSSKYLLVSLLLYLFWVEFQNQSVVELIFFWLIAGLVDRSA